jgi:signal peptidase I
VTAWPAAGACALACVTGGLVWIRSHYVLVSVAGQSMVPSFKHGDRVLVRRTAGRSPEIGEVAVLRLSRPGPGRARWVIKRVAARTGDDVPESVRAAVGGESVVPAGMLVLLGDNPHGSSDSRTRGFFPAADLLGRVVARVPSPGRDGDATASGSGDRSRPLGSRRAAAHAGEGRPPTPD